MNAEIAVRRIELALERCAALRADGDYSGAFSALRQAIGIIRPQTARAGATGGALSQMTSVRSPGPFPAQPARLSTSTYRQLRSAYTRLMRLVCDPTPGKGLAVSPRFALERAAEECLHLGSPLTAGKAHAQTIQTRAGVLRELGETWWRSGSRTGQPSVPQTQLPQLLTEALRRLTQWPTRVEGQDASPGGHAVPLFLDADLWLCPDEWRLRCLAVGHGQLEWAREAGVRTAAHRVTAGDPAQLPTLVAELAANEPVEVVQKLRAAILGAEL